MATGEPGAGVQPVPQGNLTHTCPEQWHGTRRMRVSVSGSPLRLGAEYRDCSEYHGTTSPTDQELHEPGKPAINVARIRSIVRSVAQRVMPGLCTSLDAYGKVVSSLPGSRRRPHWGHAAETADIGGRTNAGGR
jgi:hypothetical protein